MIFELGPFTLYRTTEGTLNVSLTCCDEYPWGFEWGWDDPMAGERYPIVHIRVWKLILLSYERWERKRGVGMEIRLLGFWWVR